LKTLRLILIGILFFGISSVKAQVSVNVNIGSPPQWGPMGYSDVRYYYLPDIETYYDIHTSMFIYFVSGGWIQRAYLPSRYRNYDLYSGYKVVMVDYRGNSPYTHFKEHKVKYKRGYRGPAQQNIGPNQGRGNVTSGQKAGKKIQQGNGNAPSNGKSKGSKGNPSGGGKGKKK